MSDKNKLPNRKNKIFLLILILALSAARFVYLGSVPGLHGDEALYGIKTYIMMHGNLFTLNGFNAYTGPIVNYLRIPFFYLMGSNVFSLRIPVVILSLASIFFAYRLLKELYDARTAIIAALLLLTMPWSFIYSRFSDDTHMSLIFFAICGLYYWHRASTRNANRDKILTALFLGAGVFNHLIFIIVAVSYLLYFLIKDRFRLRMDRGSAVSIFIFSVFLSLRIYLALEATAGGTGGIYYRLAEAIDRNFIHKIISSAPHFASMLDGTIFYKRTTGYLSLFVAPLNSALFITALLFIMFRRKYNPAFKAKDGMFIWILVLNYAIGAVFLHVFSLRYFMTTLMFATILIAIFLGATGMNKRLRIILVSFMVITNCFYIGYNYMYTFKKTGGRILSFRAGNFFENSLGFVDSKELYDYLREKNTVRIWVPERFLRWALIFLDLDAGRLDIKADADYSFGSVFFVSYKEDNPDRYGVGKGHALIKETTPLNNYDIFLVER